MQFDDPEWIPVSERVKSKRFEQNTREMIRFLSANRFVHAEHEFNGRRWRNCNSNSRRSASFWPNSLLRTDSSSTTIARTVGTRSNLFRKRFRSNISLRTFSFCFSRTGQAAQVLQEFINETAEFFMKTYPQLKTGREYRKIGLALIKKYPCLAEKGNHAKPEVKEHCFFSICFVC